MKFQKKYAEGVSRLGGTDRCEGRQISVFGDLGGVVPLPEHLMGDGRANKFDGGSACDRPRQPGARGVLAQERGYGSCCDRGRWKLGGGLGFDGVGKSTSETRLMGLC